MADSGPEYLNWTQYRRVLQKATTPSKGDFKRTSIVSAAGLALVGLIGFGIFFLMSFIPF